MFATVWDSPDQKKWYKRKPEGAIKSDNANVLWDCVVQCNHKMENSKADIMLIGKKGKLWIIDLACPNNDKVCDMEERKVDRHGRLAWKVKQSLRKNK